MSNHINTAVITLAMVLGTGGVQASEGYTAMLELIAISEIAADTSRQCKDALGIKYSNRHRSCRMYLDNIYPQGEAALKRYEETGEFKMNKRQSERFHAATAEEEMNATYIYKRMHIPAPWEKK